MERFLQVRFQGICLVDAKSVAVRQTMREVLGDAWARFSRLRSGGVRLKGREVKGAEPNGNLDGVTVGTNAGHDLAQDPGAIFERTAIGPGPREGAQKLMQQIAVTMLDIHEIGADVPGNAGGPHVILDQARDFG